jgi:hypothetical protein
VSNNWQEVKEMAMKIINVAVAVVSIGLLFGACSRATISPNWGVAYQEMRAKQSLDPTAGEKLDPVEGQDGRVNATAMEEYRQRFQKPESDFDRSIVSSGVKTK